MNKYDYTGKKVYVGIDVHKKSYSCVSLCDGEVVKRDRMPGRPEVLLKYLKNNFASGQIYTAYEAGFSGFHLHRYLMNEGITNIVVHAGSLEVASRDRVKTDQRDAMKIATQLASNRLRSVYVPTLEREEKRSVTRLRSSILSLRHRIGLQFKASLFTQGLIDSEDNTKLSQDWLLKKLDEVKQKGYSEGYCYSLTEYAKQWMEITERLKGIMKRLHHQAKEDNGLQTIYESVPGIGLIHARELANELGDMSQFNREKAIFSYTGLTPSEYSSGEHTRQGAISRQGKSRLRKILVEASWIAITKDPSLMDVFERLSKRRGKKRAIVGVARRLIGRIRSCVKAGMLYEIKSSQEICSAHEDNPCDPVEGFVA